MRVSRIAGIVAVVALAAAGTFFFFARQENKTATGAVPLYTNLGAHEYQITTREPRAQAYFNQGMRLYYAFNHAESIRSFREAQRLDPDCAMCWWGESLAWGPNINLPMDSA